MMIKKRILLYYKYIDLAEPEKIQQWQKALCQSLGLTGRIILATEGINGTVCGSIEATDEYIKAMNTHESFGDIDFKDSIVNGAHEYFPKLQIQIKPEIVNLGIAPDKLSPRDGGQHLTPQQAHDLIQQNPEDLVILDGRNYYEARIGAFVNAIIPPVNHFRDFPQYIDDNIDQFKNKQVLMYCTGGIRCERASAYLQAQGVAKNVYQIEGGIHRYAEQFPDGFFRGKNYVFDARVGVKVNDDIVGSCDICSIPCDAFTNCQNAKCNKHFIGCASCIGALENTCSTRCHELVATKAVPRRPYRATVDATISE